MSQNAQCPICESNAVSQPNHDTLTVFYTCPVCGRFEYSPTEQINKNYLAAYLAYHAFHQSNTIEYRYHTGLDKESCDKYRKEFDEGKRDHGRPVHMDKDIIENWYPKTFSERIDNIL